MLRPSSKPFTRLLALVHVSMCLAFISGCSDSTADAPRSAGQDVTSEGFAEDVGSGPAVATPLPEPPALTDPDLSRIFFDPDAGGTGLAGVITVEGESGSVTATARVIVTNLATGATVDTTATEEGAFAVDVPAVDEEWLRIDVEVGDQRASHGTVLVQAGLLPIELEECVVLTPPSWAVEGPIVVENTCSAPVVVQSLTAHPEGVTFSAEPDPTETPQELAPGDTLTIELAPDGRTVVLIPVEVNGEVLPYSVVIEP